MRIALVSAYDFGIPSGVNSHIVHLSNELEHRGHNTTIFAPGVGDHENVQLSGRSFPVPSGGSIARVSVSPRSSRWVRAHLERGNFDIVHVHEPLVPMLPIQFLRHADVPKLGTFHTAREKGSRLYALSHRFMRRYERLLDGRVAVSKAASRLASRYFPGRTYRHIPNGIDLKRFASEQPAPAELLALQPYVLFVGRFEKRKGIDVLLRAYRHLKSRMPELNLVVVGGGEKKSRYEPVAVRMGLKDVHFAGYVSDDLLPLYYRHAAVFCAPNTGNESFGMILTEALASQTPVVASSIQGFVDVVTHDHDALLVPPRDADALAETLEYLLKDKDLADRLTRQGIETVQRYSWEVVTDEIIAYYEELIAGAQPTERDGVLA